jgi:hypothetical protein
MLRSLHLEGDSLPSLHHRLTGELGGEENIFAVRTLSDGNPERKSVSAPSVEDATMLARRQLPSDATDIEVKAVAAPSQRQFRVAATDEDTARGIALRDARDAMQAPEISSLRELDRSLLDVLRRRRHYEVAVSSPAIVEVHYKRVAKLDAWIASGRKARAMPYEAQVYHDSGVDCTFEIPDQWSPLRATAAPTQPDMRFFRLNPRAVLDGLAGEMNFVFGKMVDKNPLRDRESRRAFLTNQIQEEVRYGHTFHNIHYYKDMESVAEEDNTLVSSAEFIGQDGTGQVVVSTVHDGVHYLFE